MDKINVEENGKSWDFKSADTNILFWKSTQNVFWDQNRWFVHDPGSRSNSFDYVNGNIYLESFIIRAKLSMYIVQFKLKPEYAIPTYYF